MRKQLTNIPSGAGHGILFILVITMKGKRNKGKNKTNDILNHLTSVA